MSFSLLSELEACPRRWALSNAHYPEVWDRPGYPSRPNLAAIRGIVIHRAIERIISALAIGGCAHPGDPIGVQVMRTLGGYSKVIAQSVESVLERERKNPRAAGMLDVFQEREADFVSSVREEVQGVISRQALIPIARAGPLPRKGRTSLGPGSYSELEVRGDDAGWAGVVDLLNLDDREIEILDFKSGQYDPKHEEQLRTYAVLWAKDSELNPAGRAATRLTLCYPGETRSVVPPDPGELDKLQRELAARADDARAALSKMPPTANVSLDNCRYCQVKHLCAEYWTGFRPSPDAQQAAGKNVDIEAQLVAQHGPRSWDARVIRSSAWAKDSPLLIRTSTPIALESGSIVKILDAQLVETEDADMAVVTLHRLTEVFGVDL